MGWRPDLDDGVVVLGAFNFPGERAAEPADEGSGDNGDGSRL